MNKLYKNFEDNGFSVEAMSCAVNCGCICVDYVCQCTDISNYYGYTYLPTVSAQAKSSTDAAQEKETYEMHYLG